MRFWVSMLLRVVWVASSITCLYSAITRAPLDAFAWVGAASGFLALSLHERREQIARGEITD